MLSSITFNLLKQTRGFQLNILSIINIHYQFFRVNNIIYNTLQSTFGTRLKRNIENATS